MSSRVCLANAGGRRIVSPRCTAILTRARLVRTPTGARTGQDNLGVHWQRLERLQATSNERDTDTETGSANVDDTTDSTTVAGGDPAQNAAGTAGAATASPSDASGSGVDTTRLSTEEIQKQMGELRRAKEEQEAAMAAKEDSLVSGVMEEVGLIQWPSFGSAFVNTLLVIAIVFGTSLVLFGVNTLLTEVSGVIYAK